MKKRKEEYDEYYFADQETTIEDLEEAKVEKLSKTQLKKQMEDLQKLGTRLISLKESQLLKLELPEELFEAIKFAKTITSNGALRRQYQYIGKLMRGVDAISIQEKIKRI